MEIFYIVLLIFFGLLFLVAELVLLPGVSIGALLALVCYGSSVYLAFRDFGTGAGILVIVIILVLSLVATVISLRAKTWQRFSLKQEIRSSSTPVMPAEELQVGDRRRDPLAPLAHGQGRDRRTHLRGQVARGLCRPAARYRGRGLREFQRYRKNYQITLLWIYRQE